MEASIEVSVYADIASVQSELNRISSLKQVQRMTLKDCLE